MMQLEAIVGSFTRGIKTIFPGKDALESNFEDEATSETTAPTATETETTALDISTCDEHGTLPSAAARAAPVRSAENDALRKKARELSEKLRLSEEYNKDLAQKLYHAEKLRLVLEREVDTLRSNLRQCEYDASQQIYSLRQELSASRDTFHSLDNALRQAQAYISDLQRQNSALQNTLEQKESLYTTQSLELRTAQTYLNTADSVPGAQVIQAVRDLNSEIQNAAPMFAEEFHFATPETTNSDSEEFKRAIDILEQGGDIGDHLLRSLNTSNNAEDPTLVQTGIQGMLASVSARCISGFLTTDSTQNVVKALHEAIRENGEDSANSMSETSNLRWRVEVQAVSGRWRALSARYIRLRIPSSTEESLIDSLLLPLTAIFVVSRCVNSASEVKDVINDKFKMKLHTIISQALSLGALIHEEVTSTDYEIVHIPAKTPFDPTAADDEYADDDADSPPAQSVLCTLELGLRQVTVIEKSESNSGEKRTSTTMLLKPKIALESAIDTMFAA